LRDGPKLARLTLGNLPDQLEKELRGIDEGKPCKSLIIPALKLSGSAKLMSPREIFFKYSENPSFLHAACLTPFEIVDGRPGFNLTAFLNKIRFAQEFKALVLGAESGA